MQTVLANAVHNLPPWDGVGMALHTSFDIGDLDLDLLCCFSAEAAGSTSASVSRGVPTLMPASPPELLLEGALLAC